MTKGAKKIANAEQLIELRTEIGHTQGQAADFLYVSLSTYQNWEYKVSRCPFAFFELYELKAISLGLLKRRPGAAPRAGG
ncbi:helix-turn-helix domain-containing protein [Ectopseudomonas hydrolytica]|uniref:helix-turn-helix domain-containing protein n=1 Tax=Ectopseudomonas hydrolytica TaxID=2493633 RepID=UPI0020B8E42B|nr:helix-turn-helix domain-containing protein [Pseudomonas hydrolytica]UTH34298.1 helix-turn-helix domain-containing protein [Pseudomonas hydrolytica]UZZ13621.1 helix-turn-helix domain-containing protein [Pseudomonas mendocina]